MNDKTWKEYFTKHLVDPKTEPQKFEDAMRDRELCIWHCDISGKKDMTASGEKVLKTK